MIQAWTRRHLQGDPVIWFIVFSLSLLSILVVYSSTGTLAYKRMAGNTEYYLLKHTSLVLLSWLAIWITHKINYRYYAKLSKVALFLAVPLLVVTWQFGLNINEASRWINIPWINQSFQPSDLASLALVVTLSAMLAKYQDHISDIKKSLLPMLMWIGLICGLIAVTNLSSAAVIFATCMVVMFIGRVPVKYLAMLALVGVVSGAIALLVGQRMGTAVSRMEGFFVEESMPFQAEQSYIAIANGGFIRFAPGKSQQKNFLPHPYSDFIYAIIIEEYGMAGGVVVLLLYVSLLYRVYRSSRAVMQNEPKQVYGGLLAAGLGFTLVVQAFINMCVSVGLMPITGLTLPLVSMGGTSQLFVGIAIGIILNVSSNQKEPVAQPSPNR